MWFIKSKDYLHGRKLTQSISRGELNERIGKRYSIVDKWRSNWERKPICHSSPCFDDLGFTTIMIKHCWQHFSHDEKCFGKMLLPMFILSNF